MLPSIQLTRAIPPHRMLIGMPLSKILHQWQIGFVQRESFNDNSYHSLNTIYIRISFSIHGKGSNLKFFRLREEPFKKKLIFAGEPDAESTSAKFLFLGGFYQKMSAGLVSCFWVRFSLLRIFFVRFCLCSLTHRIPTEFWLLASHSLGYDTSSIQTANYDSDFLPDFRFPLRSKSKKGKSNPQVRPNNKNELSTSTK